MTPTTIATHRSWGGDQGMELSRREDGTFMLRTWQAKHGRVRSVPIYLTLPEVERLFDDIGQALVNEGMGRLTEIMEAM